MKTDWFLLSNADDVPSPSLLVYPDRIEENIRRMIAIAGGTARLRPHMKTHKLPEVIQLQLQQGVTKFKCATIAECEMTAAAGATEVLLAYPPVGPNVKRLLQLVRLFPKTKFMCVVDDSFVVRALSEATSAAGVTLEVLLDMDCGMHRTGIEPGPKALELYRLISSSPGLKPGGLHAYDGHIHDADLAVRTKRVEEAYAPIKKFRDELLAASRPVPRYIASGTPTFPVHAKRGDVECSPGTCVFWDAGYGTKCPDMDFLPAALVLTRVISKPGTNRLTLDLGHKAIAAENPHPRVVFLNLSDAKAVMHSEEHLVVETARVGEFAVGDCLYGVPWHICPTVALHSQAVVVRHGHAEERWRVLGRERVITV
ncbi:MAG: D-TA family PLP-dependent enzyme [Verrucomicrobia bacterium]|nr:D-TA family PLP-dependent enzyme [Verrucomicrobiota bacterium]